jgi:glycosyltransferase involved in cell wall biosynthesis
LSILALTRTVPERHLTWKLRIGLLAPHLENYNIRVFAHQLPRDPQEKTRFLQQVGKFDIVWLHRYTSWLKFRATVSHSSAIFAASDGLVELASKQHRRVRLLPLCADPYSHQLKVTPRGSHEPLRLLWVGNKSTFRYLETVRTQLETIGRTGLPVELVVVGHSELKLSHLRVTNLRWSPAVEREQFERCHVGLAPLTIDRWTQAKATLKPLQYLANGMPFIGTPVGVNHRFARSGTQGLLAHTPDEWLSAVRMLEADEQQRQAMGQRGVDYVMARHSPEVLAERAAREFWALASDVAVAA